MVPGRGLEPPCLATYAPEAYASTNFATRACFAVLFVCYIKYHRKILLFLPKPLAVFIRKFIQILLPPFVGKFWFCFLSNCQSFF